MNVRQMACGCSACVAQEPPAWLRRRFLSTGVAAVAGAGLMGSAQAVRAQTALSPDAALERLMDGNARFARHAMTSFDEDLAELKQANVAKQEPFAAILSCADSRVPVELVFDQSIGQLFVTRVAGNVANPDIIASLEYGAAVLGVRAIMVLGHEGCGAVKAAISGKAVPGQISGLYAPLRQAVEQAGPDVEAVCKANARIQANLLASASPVLADLVNAGKMKVVAGYYALGSGQVTVLA
jgi:carbonic anhydrase